MDLAIVPLGIRILFDPTLTRRMSVGRQSHPVFILGVV